MAIATLGSAGTSRLTTLADYIDHDIGRFCPPATTVLLMIVVTDNLTTTSGASNDHVSADDTKGNAWTKLGEYTNGEGAAADGITVSLWMCRVKNELEIGDFVYTRFSGNIQQKVTTMYGYTLPIGKTLQLAAAAIGNEIDAAINFGSVSFSSLPSKQYLFVRALGKEANTTTAITRSSGFTDSFSGERSATSGSYLVVRGEMRIATDTGATSNPTLNVVGDTAGLFVALEEIDQDPLWDLDIRTTQVALLLLDGEVPVGDAYVTQTAILALAMEEVGARVTQVPVLVLAHSNPCMTQRCQVWKVTRRDGEVFAFTTHDEVVEYRGVLYHPCESLAASASSGGQLASGVGDAEVRGVLSDDSITERDLAGGLFDGATVEVWVVQWGTLEVGFIPFRIVKGVFGKISQGEVAFTAELLSPGAKLQQRPLLETLTPACRFSPGDGKCPVDVEALKVSSFVTAVGERQVLLRSRNRTFYDSTLTTTADDGYYANGNLTWLTGDNAGLSSEVKDNQSGWVILWSTMPYEIQPTDEYEMTPGCLKTRDDHTVKFGLTMATFGGYPDIPGNDAMYETPNAK